MNLLASRILPDSGGEAQDARATGTWKMPAGSAGSLVGDRVQKTVTGKDGNPTTPPSEFQSVLNASAARARSASSKDTKKTSADAQAGGPQIAQAPLQMQMDRIHLATSLVQAASATDSIRPVRDTPDPSGAPASTEETTGQAMTSVVDATDAGADPSAPPPPPTPPDTHVSPTTTSSRPAATPVPSTDARAMAASLGVTASPLASPSMPSMPDRPALGAAPSPGAPATRVTGTVRAAPTAEPPRAGSGVRRDDTPATSRSAGTPGIDPKSTPASLGPSSGEKLADGSDPGSSTAGSKPEPHPVADAAPEAEGRTPSSPDPKVASGGLTSDRAAPPRSPASNAGSRSATSATGDGSSGDARAQRPAGLVDAPASVNVLTTAKGVSPAERPTDTSASSETTAASSSVNQQIIRGAAHGVVELPDLGRVQVSAKLQDGELGVRVTPDRPETTTILLPHAAAMAAEVRTTGSSAVRVDIENRHGAMGSYTGGSSGGGREAGRHAPTETHEGDEGAEGVSIAERPRVRIVL